jgi:hypothetical protein
MKPRGTIVSQITEALTVNGPMTRKEICDFIGQHRSKVASVVTRMARETPQRPKRVYIKAYRYEQDEQRRYPRAVYALGNRPDAKKPRPDLRANKNRHVRNKTEKLRMTSVFNMGLSRRAILGWAQQ